MLPFLPLLAAVLSLIVIGSAHLLYKLQTRSPRARHSVWETLGEAIPLTPQLLRGLRIGTVAFLLFIAVLEYVIPGHWLEAYNPFSNPFIAGVFVGIQFIGWVVIAVVLGRRFRHLHRKD